MGAGSLPIRREGARIVHPGAFSVLGSVPSPEPKRSVGSLIASVCDVEHQESKSKLIATARPAHRRRDTETQSAPRWNCTTAHNGKLEAQTAIPKPGRLPVTPAPPSSTSPKTEPALAVMRLQSPPPPSTRSVSPRGRSPEMNPPENALTAQKYAVPRPKGLSSAPPTYSPSSSPTSSPTKSRLPPPLSKAPMRASPVSTSAADKSSPPISDYSQRRSRIRVFTSIRGMDDYVRRLERELEDERAAVAEKESSLADLQARFEVRESARKAMVKQLEQCQRMILTNSGAILETSESISPVPTSNIPASTLAEGGGGMQSRVLPAPIMSKRTTASR